MTQLQDWIQTNKRGVEVSENEIKNMEIKHNITFPKSYKEYLLLSGAYCPAILQSHRFENLEKRQQHAQELLKEHSLTKLITKPFWVIVDFDYVFWYIHPDEGDNPPVHRLDCEMYGDIEDRYTFSIVGESFQAWIEKSIDDYESRKQYEV